VDILLWHMGFHQLLLLWKVDVSGETLNTSIKTSGLLTAKSAPAAALQACCSLCHALLHAVIYCVSNTVWMSAHLSMTFHDLVWTPVTAGVTAVLGCQSALGPLCLPGSLCGPLGVLWLCHIATTDQILDTAVFPDKQTATGGTNGKGQINGDM